MEEKMKRQEFDAHRFHANTWVVYENELKYVISVNFKEGLLALVDEKEDISCEEWSWVRCESVTFRPKPKIVKSS